MTSDSIADEPTTTSWNLLSATPADAQLEAERQEPGFSSFPPSEAKVVIIDDQSTNIDVLQEYLKQEGYTRIVGSTDSVRALDLIKETDPDIVLLDLNMPVVDGHMLLRGIRSDACLSTVPVLMLTASDDAETRLQSLEFGATDYLFKPVNPAELIQRVRNSLALRFHEQQLADYATRLESLVRKRTEQLRIAQREAVHCLAKASEYRDHETGAHVLRIGRYSGIIAQQLGKDDEYVEALELAATLHDVGKIAVPDAILLKPGKLDPDEYEWMQRHCGLGNRLCRSLGPDEIVTFRSHTHIGTQIIETAASPLMELAARVAKTHHEKWNGLGYPLGLKGEEIPLEGRIVAVVDVFDALSIRRPYKPAFPIQKCFAILEEGRGEHFDPTVLDAFMARKDEIAEVRIEYSDD